MLINGIELSALGIQLIDRVLTSNDIQTTQDWVDGDLQPTVIRQQDSFKKMVLRFLVTEQNEENAFPFAGSHHADEPSFRMRRQQAL